ncbi:MAG: hypothetical protein ACLFQV_14000 [Vulcanimicrobiota bacterium]
MKSEINSNLIKITKAELKSSGIGDVSRALEIVTEIYKTMDLFARQEQAPNDKNRKMGEVAIHNNNIRGSLKYDYGRGKAQEFECEKRQYAPEKSMERLSFTREKGLEIMKKTVKDKEEIAVLDPRTGEISYFESSEEYENFMNNN